MTTEELITFSRIANEKLNCLMLTEQLAASGGYDNVSLWDAIDNLKNNQLRHRDEDAIIPYFDEDFMKIYGTVLANLNTDTISYMLEDIKTRNKLFEKGYKESQEDDISEDDWEE